jgi:hypothetical protein
MTSSLDVRNSLVEALRFDLVGPGKGHALAEERLRGWERPSNWYLTGFIIPSGTPLDKRGDVDEDDDDGEVAPVGGLPEESNEDRKAAKKAFFPSSLGLSFLIAQEVQSLSVTVRWGDYTHEDFVDFEGKLVKVWQRHPREASLNVHFTGQAEVQIQNLPDSQGLQVHAVERQIPDEGLRGQIPTGTRSVSVFLVNHRAPIPPGEGGPDLAYAFQAELEVTCDRPLVPRPDLRGGSADEMDDRIADLHYADTPEFASGHGISAEWELVDGSCYTIRSTWMPSAQVEKTVTVDVPDVELDMGVLGALPDGAAADASLRPLVEHYRTWIAARTKQIASLESTRHMTAEQLVIFAEFAARRIDKGVSLLSTDPQALDAFKVANRAVSRALRVRLKVDSPRWRAFQLAFLLLNLPGLADPSDPDRETVDLLFFPTGGGKTEAYLGLAAFAMVLRRCHHSGDKGLAGAGVSVIMRYTLRLLTLDQLGRAAGLVCALELERLIDPDKYGHWPFEIGLWVGKAATPNIMGLKGDGRDDTARSKVNRFKGNPRGNPSPIPLENCPWCGTRFQPESFNLLPNADAPTELRVSCANFECDFSGSKQSLPILAVDEMIYRRLPAFLIATVDKFASLPWVGRSGAILGGSDRFSEAGFFGAAEPGKGKRLEAPLPPPDLVIQDELHLISGPLGTMAGLYEAAIEALCIRRTTDGKVIKPKIVASTATVRRAQDQIQALFGRSLTQIFPPPGPDRHDSFFARIAPASEVAARLYLGIAAQGRNPKVMMRRVWVPLMCAAERMYRDAGGHKNEQNPVDPYMTVLGYFNSLRELGGARRVLEEEIQSTIKGYGGRVRIGEKRGPFQDRANFSEVVELTSRVSTDKVADARRRLECGFHELNRVDCAIATNMISVGLDIPRLGTMMVLGQPKTHSEYIQATSRVGRDDKKPGLVITLLNIHKPRDRSHYERFRHYHETFYRLVEVASVTPFSARALDKGFAGALVSLARHLEPTLTAPQGVEGLTAVRASLEQKLLDAFLERVRSQPIHDAAELQERERSVQNRVVDLLDTWQKVIDDFKSVGAAVQYQKWELKLPKPLLMEMLDDKPHSDDHEKFRANRSLRDVEPEVNLFLLDLSGTPVEERS